jgi:hypothetical protein
MLGPPNNHYHRKSEPPTRCVAPPLPVLAWLCCWQSGNGVDERKEVFVDVPPKDQRPRAEVTVS